MRRMHYILPRLLSRRFNKKQMSIVSLVSAIFFPKSKIHWSCCVLVTEIQDQIHQFVIVSDSYLTYNTIG